jgi:Zn-dependent M28 family amino/carboxypeptidase
LGANDGASGVAVLLEIARQIHEIEPPVGIDIVFFDGEDYGREGDLDNYCLGSRYFTANNVKYFPKFAILLDMIGDAQLSIPVEGYSKNYAPTVVEMVWNIAEKLGIYQFQREVRGYVFDDHVILNEGGIPAIDIIDFEYPDFSHRYWHTLEDTPDKCSPRSLKVVGDVLMELIYYELP